MSWSLNPEDVAWGETRASDASGVTKGPTRHAGTPARREMTLTLTHVPTGISVEKRVRGPFTRKQAQAARDKLWAELFPELEAKVARHLHIPGR